MIELLKLIGLLAQMAMGGKDLNSEFPKPVESCVEGGMFTRYVAPVLSGELIFPTVAFLQQVLKKSDQPDVEAGKVTVAV